MSDVCGYCLDKKATIKRFFAVCDFYGIKNKDLVKLFGVSDVLVSYWRNGTRFPEWDKIVLFAYMVGLPLEVMIIGKKRVEDQQIQKAINRIKYLKEQKYISILQELLNNGDLDFPPAIAEGVFNPLRDKTEPLDYTSTLYAKLCADVRYYGIKKKYVQPEEKSFSDKKIIKKINNSVLESAVSDSTNDKLEMSQENLLEQKENKIESYSMYIEINGNNILHLDEYGNLLNGTIIDANAYNKDKKIIILRFRNGLLDGDEYDNNGEFLCTRPAVESIGHVEYWREGRLHRDEGFPAVATEGFSIKEYWENGNRII